LFSSSSSHFTHLNCHYIIWSRSYTVFVNGPDYNMGVKIQHFTEALDYGYIVIADQPDEDYFTTINEFHSDVWLAKLSETGRGTRLGRYGTSGWNHASEIDNDVVPTTDSGYLFVGTKNYGLEGGWIVKTSKSGEIEWETSLGNEISTLSIVDLGDGNYIIGGIERFYNTDISPDMLLMKVGPTGTSVNTNSFTAYHPASIDFKRHTYETYTLSGKRSSNGNLQFYKQQPSLLIVKDKNGVVQKRVMR